MKTTWCLAVCCLTLLWAPSAGSAQESWSPAQQEVLAAIERLSASTAPGGAGADAYGAVLADDFSRWTIGSDLVNGKEDWVEGVREWFEDGWRVSDRDTRHLEIVVRDDHAFTRRVVEETYLGPEGERSTATAALAEVWVREDGEWRLLRVDVRPVDSP